MAGFVNSSTGRVQVCKRWGQGRIYQGAWFDACANLPEV
jgi:hypothetical protein